jgi:hypothetical protein
MAGIERLAGALFREQSRKTDDPVLREIFDGFVTDEVRHSHVAQMLADYYDVKKLKLYRMSDSLARFYPHFVDAVRFLPPDLANVYITSGELILDIALLRALNEHVHDEMSQRAMDLVNRDESRHIAIDFHMVEYYCSDEWIEKRARLPKPGARERARATWAFGNVLYYASPFFRDVFFEPMRVVDPSGKRLREAFKRIQLLGTKPVVAQRPFSRFMLTIQGLYNTPVVGTVFGGVLERLGGVTGEVLTRLYTDEERRRTAEMSFDALADDALAAKHLG